MEPGTSGFIAKKSISVNNFELRNVHVFLSSDESSCVNVFYGGCVASWWYMP
jgi:hypothetical protein